MASKMAGNARVVFMADIDADTKPGLTSYPSRPGYHLAKLSGNTVIQAPDDPPRQTHIALDNDVRTRSIAALNQLLVDTIMIRDMYKKHHWQLSGITFYQLHLLFDAHYNQLRLLVDEIAERVQLLGGVSIGMPADVAAHTHVNAPPTGREAPDVQITRLVLAHRTVLTFAHEAAAQAGHDGDDRTNDIIVSSIIREHEKQSWFISEHLVPVPLMTALNSEADH